MSTGVQYLICGKKQVRIPEDATPHQINLTYKRLAWMIHHNGLRFPAELDKQLRDNGMKRRKKGKKNNNETQSINIEVSAEALLLIDLGKIFKYITLKSLTLYYYRNPSILHGFYNQ